MSNFYANDALQLALELLQAVTSGQTDNGTPIGLDDNAKVYLDMRLDQLIDSLQNITI